MNVKSLALVSVFSLGLIGNAVGNYPSRVSDAKIECPKGRCLLSTADLPIGTVVEKFEGTTALHEYRAGMNLPIESRHVKWIGRDFQGIDKWIFVTSNAAYVNHSCNPNCRVNENLEVVTMREVKAGQELTISYNSLSLNGFPADMEWKTEWSFVCLCDTHNCQKLINKFIE